MRVWNFDYQNVLLESLVSLDSYDVAITAALRPSLSLDGIRLPHYRLSATITAVLGELLQSLHHPLVGEHEKLTVPRWLVSRSSWQAIR